MGSWCLHRNQTTPRRDDEGEYCRCLECGERLPWSWPDGFPHGEKRHPSRLPRPTPDTSENDPVPAFL